jgi:hypothetical protein
VFVKRMGNPQAFCFVLVPHQPFPALFELDIFAGNAGLLKNEERKTCRVPIAARLLCSSIQPLTYRTEKKDPSLAKFWRVETDSNHRPLVAYSELPR